MVVVVVFLVDDEEGRPVEPVVLFEPVVTVEEDPDVPLPDVPPVPLPVLSVVDEGTVVTEDEVVVLSPSAG
ncbi:MAG: hypothetical protein IJE00_04260 [Clostridia bacterium]|nr:hypothetical protein [Clostridia bacterium]